MHILYLENPKAFYTLEIDKLKEFLKYVLILTQLLLFDQQHVLSAMQ